MLHFFELECESIFNSFKQLLSAQYANLNVVRKKYRGVAIGGTFDMMHAGHRALIQRAFSIGEHVVIGLTSDDFVARSGKKTNHDFKSRKSQLESYLKERYQSDKYEIAKLENRFGPGIFTPTIEAIVVSPETLRAVDEANTTRRSKGLPDLKVEVTPIVLAEDGGRISSTRIRAGEIDSEGRLKR